MQKQSVYGNIKDNCRRQCTDHSRRWGCQGASCGPDPAVRALESWGKPLVAGHSPMPHYRWHIPSLPCLILLLLRCTSGLNDIPHANGSRESRPTLYKGADHVYPYGSICAVLIWRCQLGMLPLIAQNQMKSFCKLLSAEANLEALGRNTRSEDRCAQRRRRHCAAAYFTGTDIDLDSIHFCVLDLRRITPP